MKAIFFVAFILIQTISFSYQTGPTVPSGKYIIVNKDNCDVFDIEKSSKECGANLVINDKTGCDSQIFVVCNIYGDFVTLTNLNSGLTLSAENKKQGSKIEQVKLTGYPNAYQLFKFIEVCEGVYLIYNKASDLYVNGNSCATTQFGNRAAILSEKCFGDIDHLLFTLIPIC